MPLFSALSHSRGKLRHYSSHDRSNHSGGKTHPTSMVSTENSLFSWEEDKSSTHSEPIDDVTTVNENVRDKAKYFGSIRTFNGFSPPTVASLELHSVGPAVPDLEVELEDVESKQSQFVRSMKRRGKASKGRLLLIGVIALAFTMGAFACFIFLETLNSRGGASDASSETDKALAELTAWTSLGTVLGSVALALDPGETQYAAAVFFLLNGEERYTVAKAKCEIFPGGQLAIIEEEDHFDATQAFVRNTMEKYDFADKNIYVGLIDPVSASPESTSSTSRFKFIDGKQLGSFGSQTGRKPWAGAPEAQPNNGGPINNHEDCVVFSSSHAYFWNDLNCNEIALSLCMVKIVANKPDDPEDQCISTSSESTDEFCKQVQCNPQFVEAGLCARQSGATASPTPFPTPNPTNFPTPTPTNFPTPFPTNFPFRFTPFPTPFRFTPFPTPFTTILVPTPPPFIKFTSPPNCCCPGCDERICNCDLP